MVQDPFASARGPDNHVRRRIGYPARGRGALLVEGAHAWGEEDHGVRLHCFVQTSHIGAAAWPSDCEFGNDALAVKLALAILPEGRRASRNTDKFSAKDV